MVVVLFVQKRDFQNDTLVTVLKELLRVVVKHHFLKWCVKEIYVGKWKWKRHWIEKVQDKRCTSFFIAALILFFNCIIFFAALLSRCSCKHSFASWENNQTTIDDIINTTNNDKMCTKVVSLDMVIILQQLQVVVFF